MSIADKVKVNTYYTRSINLERDASSLEVIKAYIPTSRALKFFDRVANGFADTQAPRAWSIVGPYGSGKSSAQSFLAHLLGEPGLETTQTAHATLRKASSKACKAFAAEVTDSRGYLKVLITGSPEPMGKRIVRGLLEASQEFWSVTKGAKPKVIAEIESASKLGQVSTSEIVSLISNLQLALEKAGCKGIVLAIDELGKFLEFEARHYGANDIYLLQALAEHACSAGSCKLFLFVLLHQSFEQYAKGLGESLKSEWSKVQGRFEEIPFLESSEQVLRIVSAALEQNFNKGEKNKVEEYAKGVATLLVELEAAPGAMDVGALSSLLANCYPLHPVSAILLPRLCQMVAQNERTLFSYLGSHEEHGLQDMLRRIENVGGWVYPHNLFDYFITNQPAVVGDYSTHRRWVEVVTALERLGDAPRGHIEMLKTIGLMNIVGAKGGFKPSKALLEVCAPSKKAASAPIKELVEKSIVNFRKFSGEYRVWQGSDFDLEAAVAAELDNLGEFSLADTLNTERSLMPVVARRYTIRSGTLRYFVPEFVDALTYKKVLSQSDEPRMIFFLATAQDDEKLFYDDVVNHFSALDVVALCLNGGQLRNATAEVLALRQVRNNRQELNSDPVAKREYDDRLASAEEAEQDLLQDLLSKPDENVWFYKAKQLEVGSKREFQEELSRILSKAYSKAPVIHNEMINRDRPSSQANAGRNKLLIAMLNHADKTDLGIEKFPPEKAIYRSLLRETGLHDPEKLEFQCPSKESTLYAVWQRIEEFLDSTEKKPEPFSELNKELIAPPYGLKAGVLPILYMAVYVVYQNELALYEERNYKPFFTEDMVERFVKRPDQFSVQRFRITGLRASIYEEYSKIIQGGAEKKTVIELVRPLANWIGGLEQYSLRTKSSEISENAKAVRDAFRMASSPESLLFEDIPRVLGFSGELSKDKPNLEGLASSLQASLQELKQAYPLMLKQQVKLLAQAFRMEEFELSALRRKIFGRYEGLDQHTVDVDGLKAFIKRLTRSDCDDEAWLENVLMFLGQKPTSKWADSNRNEADVRLSDFAKRILDLEALRLHYDKTSSDSNSDHEFILLKIIKRGAVPIDEVVAIDKTRHKAIQDVKKTLRDALAEHKDTELQLAVLAELVDDFLSERRDRTSVIKHTKPKIRQVKNA